MYISNLHCILVTLGFFDDILIPVNALQHPSRFDETDQAWVWEYPKEDGEKHDLFMDSGKKSSKCIFPEAVPNCDIISTHKYFRRNNTI